MSVSYGYKYALAPGSLNIKFDENKLFRYTSVDERNLMHCQYLGFIFTSIVEVNTRFLMNLKVLVLFKSKISQLDTTNLG